MAKELKKFNVILYKYPGKVEHYDVLPYFREYWKDRNKYYRELRSKVIDKNSLRDWIRDRSHYMFWGRCEWECVISSWPFGSKRISDDLQKLLTPEFDIKNYEHSIKFYNAILQDSEKIDVHEQIMMNIDVITDILAAEFKIDK